MEDTRVTETEIANSAGSLCLAPAPRSLPLSVRLMAILGTPFGFFCWFVIGLGMIAVWVFTLSADFQWPLFLRATQTVQGKVIGVGKGLFVRRNNTPIRPYKYVYVTPDGKRRDGTAFSDTRSFQVGEEVDVEYLPARPWISRIGGTRSAPVSLPVGLALTIFPALGLVLLAREMRLAARALRLMRNGRLAYGVRKSRRATAEKIDYQRVYEYIVEFRADNLQTYWMKARTSKTKMLEDQEREALLYDPTKPPVAVLLDMLPGQPRIDSSGNFVLPEGIWRRIAYLSSVPVLTVVGHGIYIYLRFLR